MSDKTVTINHELEVPAASPPPAAVTLRLNPGNDLADFDDSLCGGDTEPNLDVQLLRVALHAGSNK